MRPFLPTISTCLLALLGGPLLGGIIGLILGFGLDMAMGGGHDDAPGGGLILFLVIGLGALVGSAVGFCVAAESIQCLLEAKHTLDRKRLRSRFLFGLASLVGPLWIYLFWPPHRSPYESHTAALLLYGISICLAIAALRITLAGSRKGL
jgi:hypothetical protein